MPHAHKLVQCVAIENTLNILKNTHAHALNLCRYCKYHKNTQKYSCPTPTTLYCV